MKLLLELQILITATTLVWFEVIGGHQIILKWLGKSPWDHIKPLTCWFCTQYYVGIAVVITYELIYGYDLKVFALTVALNLIIAKVIDSKWGFDLGLKAEIKRLEKENRELKNKQINYE